MKFRGLTVSKLIDKLKELPQDAVCVVPGFDHSYSEISYAESVIADFHMSRMSECYPDDGCPAMGKKFKW